MKIAKEILKIPTIGEVIQEEFLGPKGLTVYKLSEMTGISMFSLNQIISFGLEIGENNDEILTSYFGLLKGYFLRLQDDLRQVKKERDAILLLLQQGYQVSKDGALVNLKDFN
jgi:plasmid maintenance system antidote protein VapI